jgi:hypothetical protein
MIDRSITLDKLMDGRSRAELDACKDGLLVVAGNMFYDDKLSNSQYNDIVGALIQIRDILDRASKTYTGTTF